MLGQPTKPIEQCSVCSVLSGGVRSFTKSGEVVADSLTPKHEAVSRLRELLRLGENVATTWIEQCTECHAVYVAERLDEYFVDGREEEESYRRTTAEKVLEMPELGWNRKPGALLRDLGDGVFAVIGEPHKRWKIRRAQ